MGIRKAVIPAAGLGTRFLPATKAQPKEMLPLVDTPIIQYVVEEAIASGINDILIITGRNKRAIEDHFDRSLELEFHLERGQKAELLNWVRDIASMANIHFVRQKEALGLGHAILQARSHVGHEPFAVLLGDEVFFGPRPCLKELIDLHVDMGGSAVAVTRVPHENVGRYGIIQPETVRPGLHRVTALVEKPEPEAAPSDLAIVGRYIIDPAIFDILEQQPPGKNGEIQLTDALQTLNLEASVYACEVQATRYDVGDKLGYLQATVELALRRPDLGPSFAAYLRSISAELIGAAG